MQLENSKIPSPAPKSEPLCNEKMARVRKPNQDNFIPRVSQGALASIQNMNARIIARVLSVWGGQFEFLIRGLLVRGLEPKLRKWLGACLELYGSGKSLCYPRWAIGSSENLPIFPPVSDLNFLVPDLVPVDHVFHSKRMWGLTVGFLGFGIWNTLWTKLSWSCFRARAILALHN